MKRTLNLHTMIAITMLSLAVAVAQTGESATQHFEKGGLALEYPLGWTLTESGGPGMQRLTIASKGNLTRITINVERTFNRSCDLQAEIENMRSAEVEILAGQIHAGSPVRTSQVQTQVGTSVIEGARLQGVIDRKRVIADVYAARLNQRFVSLIYMRNDQDGRAQHGWELVRKTMKLQKGVLTYGTVTLSDSDSVTTRDAESVSGGGNILNGRALALPKPSYPPIARTAHASGTVVVQIVIDEAGDVSSAHVVSGHPLLAGVSLAAAKEAKFSPTKYCGEPLWVTGVIHYNFVEQ